MQYQQVSLDIPVVKLQFSGSFLTNICFSVACMQGNKIISCYVVCIQCLCTVVAV